MQGGSSWRAQQVQSLMAVYPSTQWPTPAVADVDVLFSNGTEARLRVLLPDAFPDAAPVLLLLPAGRTQQAAVAAAGALALAHPALAPADAQGASVVAPVAVPALRGWNAASSLLGAAVADALRALSKAPPVLTAMSAATPSMASSANTNSNATTNAMNANSTGGSSIPSSVAGALAYGISSTTGSLNATVDAGSGATAVSTATLASDSPGGGIVAADARIPSVPARLPEVAGMTAERASDLLSSAVEYQVWYQQLDCVTSLRAARARARDELEALALENVARHARYAELLTELETREHAYLAAVASVAVAERARQDRIDRLSLAAFLDGVARRAEAFDAQSDDLARRALASPTSDSATLADFLQRFRSLRVEAHRNRALLRLAGGADE